MPGGVVAAAGDARAIPSQKSAEKRKNTSGRNGKDLFTVSGFYFA